MKRAKVLWNVIQTPGIDYVSASDKDFYPAFLDLIELGIIVLRYFARNQEISTYINERIDYKLIWKMWDNLLNKLYGNESKISKEEWFDEMQRLTPWVLKPENMRVYAFDTLKNIEAQETDDYEYYEPCGHHKFRGIQIIVVPEDAL